MVISFQEKRVREFLLKNGRVYTFRYYNKDTPIGQRKQTGKDWANSGRGTCKIADVCVTPIEYLDALNMGIVLTKYIRESGFYPGRGRLMIRFQNGQGKSILCILINLHLVGFI